MGDSSWRVIGPDLPRGVSVRVLRVEGATLVVEAA
jgi:membrane protein implicated in regulation of membrane protease activity